METRAQAGLILSLGMACAFAADAPTPRDARDAANWTTLWQDAFRDKPVQFDPEKVLALAFADRTTGDTFLAMWDYGVWKSTDSARPSPASMAARFPGRAAGQSATASI